jgi:hypothetical protein
LPAELSLFLIHGIAEAEIPDFSYLDDMSGILAAQNKTLIENKENFKDHPISVGEVKSSNL